jgi:glycosyltransferase involved in cell wall biosynthesis
MLESVSIDLLKKKKRIFIATSIYDDWGGSETIWFDLAKRFVELDYQVFVLKSRINRHHRIFSYLQSIGVFLVELEPDLGKKDDVEIKSKFNHRIANFSIHLAVYQPDLVIVNQGVNFDGLELGYYCLEQKIKYIIIANKAVDFFWPYILLRSEFKQALLNSQANYFVSDQNLKMTQEQFGMEIPNAHRAYYPVKKFKTPKSFLETNGEVRFALIGRLYLLDKGQDILFRILAKPKWKQRNIKVSIIGSGMDEEGLKDMANYLELKNVDFLGYVDNETIWDQYHGLLLPSRSEGFPLVVQEAMAAGRIVVTTYAGGSSEIVIDGETGFISKIDQDEFEEAMERCWQSIEKWPQIAKNAFEKLNQYLPDQPTSNILQFVQDVINK